MRFPKRAAVCVRVLGAKTMQADTPSDTLTTRQAADLLGMSITSVQKMVEAGELEAWVTPGGHRRIRRHEVERVLQGRKSSKVRPSGNVERMRVLLVEDDPIQACLFETVVGRYPFSIDLTVAGDGSMALVQLERQRPDLLVTDLMMAPIDGYHLVEMLDRDEAYYPIDVLVVSAMDEVHAREKGHLPDWVTFYQKPFDQSRLMGYLDSLRVRVIKRARNVG